MRVPGRASFLTTAAVTLTLVAACSGGGSTQPRALDIVVDPTSLTMSPGDSTDLSVTIGRVGFTDPVVISVQGLPASVRADTVNVPADTTSATVSLVADSSARSDSTVVSIQAVAGNGASATAEVVLVIRRPAQSGFSLTLGTDSAALAPGVPVTLDVVITRSGSFKGFVGFVAAGMPSGMIAVFDPDSTAGDTTRLVLTADTSVAMDSVYELTVTGSGQGVGDVTDTLYAVVSASSTASFSLQPATDSIVMSAGETDTVDVRVARAAGFTGPVALSVAGMPAGLGVTPVPSKVVGDSALMVVRADTALGDGTYHVELRGSSQGVADVADTLAVTIGPAQGAPTFGLTFGLDSSLVSVGVPDTVVLAVQRTVGMPALVSFALDSLPTGVAVTMGGSPLLPGDTVTLPGDSVALAVTADSTATAGTTFPFTGRGWAGSYSAVTDTLWLTVSPGSASSPPSTSAISPR